MRYIILLIVTALTFIGFSSADYVSIAHIQGNENYHPATYIYNKCMESGIPTLKGDYSCLEMIKTFTTENAMRNPILKSPTKDYGICQLHYPVHKSFINSNLFTNRNTQLDYCFGVRVDASKKGSMPWYANKRYDYKNSKQKNARLKSLRNSVQVHVEPKQEKMRKLTSVQKIAIKNMQRKIGYYT